MRRNLVVVRAGYRLLIAEAYLRRVPHRWDLHNRLTSSFATPDVPAERMGPDDGCRFTAAQTRADQVRS